MIFAAVCGECVEAIRYEWRQSDVSGSCATDEALAFPGVVSRPLPIVPVRLGYVASDWAHSRQYWRCEELASSNKSRDDAGIGNDGCARVGYE
jgi:hypothetical protein